MVDRTEMLLSIITTFDTFWVMKEVGVFRTKEKLTPDCFYAVQNALFAQRLCVIYEERMTK
jgi:hypothetical protein